MGFFGLIILGYLLVPILIIGAIVYVVRLLRRRSRLGGSKTALAFSREDALSQWFVLFALTFLFYTLSAWNRNLVNPLDGQTIFLAIVVIALFLGYYFKLFFPFLAGILGFKIWWIIQALDWMGDRGSAIRSAAVVGGVVMITLLYYLLGRIHEQWPRYSRYALSYLILGILGITGLISFFSTELGLGLLSRMTSGVHPFASFGLAASFIVFLAGIAFALFYGNKFRKISIYETAAILAFLFLFVLLMFVPPQAIFEKGARYGGGWDFWDGGSGRSLTSLGILWAVIFNLLAFFQFLGIILLGYRRREAFLVNLGAFLLFLLIVLKYFDWFFTFLNKSLFFIGAGVLLFGVGWFMERGRRYMVRNIRSGGIPGNVPPAPQS